MERGRHLLEGIFYRVVRVCIANSESIDSRRVTFSSIDGLKMCFERIRFFGDEYGILGNTRERRSRDTENYTNYQHIY